MKEDPSLARAEAVLSFWYLATSGGPAVPGVRVRRGGAERRIAADSPLSFKKVISMATTAQRRLQPKEIRRFGSQRIRTASPI